MEFKLTEKNPFGQKPKQQRSIKNIYRSMKQQNDNKKLNATEKNFKNYVNKISKKDQSSSTARSVNKTIGKINDTLDSVEKLIR